ncbi:MAG: NF041680 family putative transposase [Xenococcaceae cyanobacterium MO_207.B15]|nr:NF041680 family putative transposase [Xenococcaceae cyanobacterium MO_207.B15]
MMTETNRSQNIKDFQQWRTQLYNSLSSRREAVIQLIDALSSNVQANSVVELSLNPLFERNYNSLYRAIQEFLPDVTSEKYQKINQDLLRTVSQTIPQPHERHFNLFGIDTTPAPRPFSHTLEDKTYIYYPNPIKGNKPINIGHSYSVVAALPEKNEAQIPWAVPISGERVPSGTKAIALGNQQLKYIFENTNFPPNKLSVLVADSSYSQREFIGEQVKENNLVTITRVRSDRVFYRQFIPDPDCPKKSGHPRWYGDKFDLKDATTWHLEDEVFQSNFITKKGKHFNLTICAWKNMLMKGTSNYQMNSYPFTLLQITISDEQENIIWKPMWLIVIGSRRHDLSLQDCYQAYRQRYDLEHLFRFGKQKLLMTSYLTPEVKHEENWFKLTLLAYVNLWAARDLAVVLPREWEQYLKRNEAVKITPSLVQRDFYRIISQIGKITKTPKRRGYSSGRIKGYKKAPRTRHQVIKKTKKVANQKLKAS